jgi:hypothetical protein
MRKVWITALTHDEAPTQSLMRTVATYGLAVDGHFWADDLKNVAWASAAEPLENKETVLWIITGPGESFRSESIRYGLAMLALQVQGAKGFGFPVAVIPSSGEVAAAELPTPLRAAEVLPLTHPTLGVKLVALANTPVKPPETAYRLNVFAPPGIGQWLEVGPAKGHAWHGALVGVDVGEINAHGVGPAGRLPEKAVLEYPMKGLKLQFGGREFTAWAVKNALSEGESYFVRLTDYPATVLFGPFPEGDDADLFTLQLK